MKKLLKSVVTVALAAMMAVSVVPQNIQAAEIVDQGNWVTDTYGEKKKPKEFSNIHWTVDDEGILRISGSGDYKGKLDTIYYSDLMDPEGKKYHNYPISQIILEDGMTMIPAESLRGYNFTLETGLYSIVIPKSVTEISLQAFDKNSIKSETIDDMEVYTFIPSNKIYYEGSESDWDKITFTGERWIDPDGDFDDEIYVLPKDMVTFNYGSESPEEEPEHEPCTITYKFMDGREDITETYDYNTFITKDNLIRYPESVNPETHTFGGWYNDEACTDEFLYGSIKEDITLYAKWSPRNYHIWYNLKGGKFTKKQEKNIIRDYNFETDTFTLPKPKRTGYKFKGWYLSKNYSKSSKITQIEKGTTGEMDLYAKWKKK